MTRRMASVVKPGRDELWARLEALPPNVKGEIIDGELYTQPRPRFRHARATGFLGHHLGGGFDYDEGGPGGCPPDMACPIAVRLAITTTRRAQA